MPPVAGGSGSRWAFLGVLGVLMVVTLLPSRWSGWTGAPAALLRRVIAPAAHPIANIAKLFGGDGGTLNHELMTQLEHERDHFKALWLREHMRSQDLTRTVEQLQKGAMYGDVPVKQLARPVWGGATDGRGGMLLVRTGSNDQVMPRSVATTAGVQVVGLVVGTDSRTCWVRLITHPDAGKTRGVLMGADERPGATVELTPVKGRAVLQGVVEYLRGSDGKQAPAVGQVVRVDDPLWPKSSRMLVLGTVSEVKPVATGARQIIEVTPTVDLERLSELVLRISPPDVEDAPPPSLPATPTGKTGRSR